jgi:hypothetical protein
MPSASSASEVAKSLHCEICERPTSAMATWHLVTAHGIRLCWECVDALMVGDEGWRRQPFAGEIEYLSWGVGA